MRCPFCGQDQDKVIDSRATDGGRSIRRRRECLPCHKRFTTYEYVEETVRLTVIKKDGSRVPYRREKIAQGVERACYKRPIAADAVARLVEEVEEELFRQQGREVQSAAIGKLVVEKLKRLDQVAYVRFASVYKQFRDLDDFLNEVRGILDTPPEAPGQGKLFG